jgi:hypothetical protein
MVQIVVVKGYVELSRLLSGFPLALLSFQRNQNPLQMPIPLHSPDVRRHGLSLRRLQARITQADCLTLDAFVAQSLGQLAQAHPGD